ncbi:DUF4062 domain-containing protein [Leclercia sp.]|uniref:DUF4062 domain-containing protein n=1 Tax=Leclercia sp. TaxID=1898428 RepID=UPI0028A7F1CC|nr:DUF4062 domain-containing protein [Leclercia sp.]
MNRKFQVFISSTFTDLIEERQAAVSAILTAGHIPAGMELFKPGDRSQLEIIKRWIDESDIYILILGGRYGTIAPGSDYCYTELEYDYALNTNKPLFSIVIDDKYLDEKVRMIGKEVLELDNPTKYEAFKQKVKGYPVEFFQDNKDIQISIYKTLPQIGIERNLLGWVSGKEISESSVLIDQISKLTKENENLKSEIELLRAARLPEIMAVEDKPSYEEFSKIYKLFENTQLTIPTKLSETPEPVKTTAMRLILMYRGKILSGLRSNATDFTGFLVRNVCTLMMVHGLLKTTPIMENRYLRYELTEKGAAFFSYIDLHNLPD